MPASLARLVFVLIALAFAPTLPLRADDASHLIGAADLLRIRQLESPAVSPDGQSIVYVVRSLEPKPGAPDDGETRTHLWLVPADGHAPARQLTRGPATDSDPVWHPDGRRLVFVRAAPQARPQLHLLDLAGGEAEPLTQLPNGATAPRWAPDGTQLLFSSTLSEAEVRAALETAGQSATPPWAGECPGRAPLDTANWKLPVAPAAAAAPATPAPARPATAPDGTLAEIREWLARNEADANPRVLTRSNFLAEGDLQPDLTFAQLYLLPLRAGATPQPLALSYEARTAAAWLRDGRTIVFTTPTDPALHPDRVRPRRLATLEVSTGAVTVLRAHPTKHYAEPTPSPDGRWIAFTAQENGPFSFAPARVAVLPVGGGEPRLLTADLDRSVGHLRWDDASAHVYFVAPDAGRFPLFRVPVAGSAAERLTTAPDWGIRDFDLAGGTLAQVVSHPGNPWELHAGPAVAGAPRAVTDHNQSWLAGKQLSAYEPHRFVNAEGLAIDYWTMKPADFDPAKKYPLLVNLHGGPTAMWGPGEASTWHEFQFFAARGYALVFANPRGSGGYGEAFQRANFRDWGAGPARDVLAAADFAARDPSIDPARQVLTGGSYGGYLVAWIVGHDHRFKAAVAQRGVYDLATFFGEGNAWFLVPLYFGGYPWEPEVRRVLERESPLTYVAQIRTPLLIKHGDVDFRTGVVQSQMLYKSLKLLERPVEYVRYPRATHELSRAGEVRQRIDRLVRFEEFFRRHLGPTP